ncbi:glycosyltransferase [Luteolibacter flavescens]|uniref:Glycosyltransferase n=1 Tax=Luteolibacter flavescens TaxID=1859460 RepID=A0ABT3FIN7_9BACT|nr:glycosyltransferase [Luteolibacter flavescens]MCW1883437.1 glycosyltransferase [Luteolibacter flavescens]
MRIDIVTDTFAPDVNGVAMTLGRLCDGLRRRGHLVHVIRTGEGGGRGETIAPSVSLPGYKEVRVGLPGSFKLRKRWMKRRPDAIYVATESPLGISAIKTANALEIPVATGFHTNFHQYMEQYRLGGLQPAAMAYLKKVHSRANLTMAPTRDVVDMLLREGFQNVRLLGRGVDTELFHPAKRDAELRASWGARDGSPVAIIVGRVAAEKNLAFAMECFRKMRERMPDLACVVVGDGPIREKLQAEHTFVHFAGVQTGENLARHYASADILLFPSETETFGNVLLEGMASGLVTVSHDYAASGRHVIHGGNGLKAPKGDREAYLAECFTALDRWRDSAFRDEARATTDSLGWDQVVESFENHLQEACEARGPVTLTLKEKSKRPKRNFRTIFISDVHLGTEDAKVHEVIDFLKHTRCEKLVLNGDIIDGWALKRGAKWRKRHSRFIRTVLKKMEKDDTEVIYLRGNHDDILDRFLPLAFGKMQFVKEHIHVGVDAKRYLVVHGDGFDSVSTNHKWVAVIGAVGYDLLLKVNRVYNKYRAWRGKEYYSVSKAIKAKVKSAVSFVGEYEQQLQELARTKNCDGIICGHIHTPEDKQVGEIRYLNSGDWVESLTAIVEHHDGRLELIRHAEFMAELASEVRPARGAAANVIEMELSA